MSENYFVIPFPNVLREYYFACVCYDNYLYNKRLQVSQMLLASAFLNDAWE